MISSVDTPRGSKCYTISSNKMSFVIQALSAGSLIENEGKLTEKLIGVPREADWETVNRKLSFLGIAIDKLTPAQEEYLNGAAV